MRSAFVPFVLLLALLAGCTTSSEPPTTGTGNPAITAGPQATSGDGIDPGEAWPGEPEWLFWNLYRFHDEPEAPVPVVPFAAASFVLETADGAWAKGTLTDRGVEERLTGTIRVEHAEGQGSPPTSSGYVNDTVPLHLVRIEVDRLQHLAGDDGVSDRAAIEVGVAAERLWHQVNSRQAYHALWATDGDGATGEWHDYVGPELSAELGRYGGGHTKPWVLTFPLEQGLLEDRFVEDERESWWGRYVVDHVFTDPLVLRLPELDGGAPAPGQSLVLDEEEGERVDGVRVTLGGRSMGGLRFVTDDGQMWSYTTLVPGFPLVVERVSGPGSEAHGALWHGYRLTDVTWPEA